jgi:hypothetical protein
MAHRNQQEPITEGDQIDMDLSLFILCKFSWTMWLPLKKGRNKTNSGALVRQQTIPTERPPLVGEFNANFSR